MSVIENINAIIAKCRNVTDPVLLWQYADEIIAKSQAVEYRHGEAFGLLYRAWSSYESLQRKEAEADLEEAEVLFAGFRDPYPYAQLFRLKGLLLDKRGEWTRALECYEKGLEFCRLGNDRIGEGILWNLISIIHRNKGRLQQAVECAEQSLLIHRRHHSPIPLIAALGNFAAIQELQNNYAEAIVLRKEAIETARSAKHPHALASCLLNLGSHYLQIGDVTRALQAFNECIPIQRQLQRWDALSHALWSCGCAYNTMQQWEAAITSFQEGILYACQIGQPILEGLHLLELATSLDNLGRTTEALQSIQQAITVLSRVKSSPNISTAWIRYGEILRHQGNYSESHDAFTRAYEIQLVLQQENAEGLYLFNIAQIHIQKNEFQEAIQLLQQALPLLDTKSAWQKIINLHKCFSDALSAVGDFKNALEHFATYHTLQQKSISQEATQQLTVFRIAREVESLENEREKAQVKIKNLEALLDDKQRELLSFSATMIGNEATQSLLTEGLQRLLKLTSGAAQQQVIGMLNLVNSNNGTPEQHAANDEEFDRQFINFQQDFARHIAAQFPTLTPMELRICSLLKLQMSTKEIANVLGLSPRSIENHRYRLRQKLNLTELENLSVFLARLDKQDIPTDEERK